MKRPHAALAEGETEIVDVESAQSSLRQNSVRYLSFRSLVALTALQRKKARIADGQRPLHLRHTDTSDSEDVAGSDADGIRNRKSRGASELDLDDQSDEELDRQMATQLSSKRRETMDNRPADYGVIEMVTCSNFMCHGYLEVPLGPLINFIIGHNGSGKSAVLTALTLCLGGKASATNRGQSLKSFIKEGQELVQPREAA